MNRELFEMRPPLAIGNTLCMNEGSVSPLTSHEKQAVPYVMKSTELLFAAWFSTQNDTVCAEDAMKIFSFVDANKKEILNILK